MSILFFFNNGMIFKKERGIFMTLGEKLKQLRAEKGVFQRELSDLLEIGITTISGYEHDTIKPKLDTLKKLANFYGVTVNYLLGTEASADIEKEFSRGAQLLRRAVNELTPEERDVLANLMEAFLNK